MTPTKIHHVLSRDEIRALCQSSNLRGALDVFTDWAMIAAAMALVAWQPHVVTILLALIIIGGRQLALAILMHEASHRMLFRSRILNDVIGRWLCAAPIWTDLERYRSHHLAHHAFTGTERDTDLGLIAPFPTSRRSMLRKFVRDLSGVASIRRVIATLLMDLGLITYTASTNTRRVDPSELSAGLILRNFLHRTLPVLIVNAALFSILWALGHPLLYLLWFGAWMTTFSLFFRIRAIAEHACTTDSDNVFLNTRTTLASPLAILTVAPHHVNYHLEHHLLMTAPHYHLKKIHRLLHERGALDTSHVAPNYLHVLRSASTAS